MLFDTVAIYLAADESLCEMQDIKLSVNDEGMTVPDDNGRVVRVHTGWRDRDAFEDLLVKAIAGD